MPDSLFADRVAGILLGTAAGDALGAGYEFGPSLPDTLPISMKGGGGFGWAPGEWTDDTSMAIAVAEVLENARSRGIDGFDGTALDALVMRWEGWAQHAPDVGNQTRAVLHAARRGADAEGHFGAAEAVVASDAFHRQTGMSAGNGSLMRTAPVALAFLNAPPTDLADAAIRVSKLTHWDDSAGEACVLWTAAIRHAVRNGSLDVRVGLPLLDEPRRAKWRGLIEVAERSHPRDFSRNGWVVEAFQGAWSAITTTRDNSTLGSHHLVIALETAVRGGHDTDTVAAIAGGLLGAAYGASAIPESWIEILHGWPGFRAHDLPALAYAIAVVEPSAQAEE